MNESSPVVLVTGAASGIGAATARLLLDRGSRVALADLAAPSITDENAIGLALDVTEEAAWEDALSSIQTRWGRLDGVVACAGITGAAAVTETTLSAWRRIQAVNLDGAFLAVKHGLRAMRPRRAGVIVIVASASGIKATPGACAYAASKAGAIHLAKSAALECAKDNIRIHAIAPGAVKTPMWTQAPFWAGLLSQAGGDEDKVWAQIGAATPTGRVAEPEEVAEVIAFLLSERASAMTAAVIPVDGGYIA